MKLPSTLFLAIISILLLSCQKSSKTIETKTPSVHGSWEMLEERSINSTHTVLMFQENGVFKRHYTIDCLGHIEKIDDRGNWKIEGNELIIEDPVNEYIEQYDILELTENDLVIKPHQGKRVDLHLKAV